MFAARGGIGLYGLLVRGSLTVDLGIGRTVRPLWPLAWQIAAPRELVFESSRLPTSTARRTRSRASCACSSGGDMVLAAHFTPVGPLVTTTLETVRFEHPSG